MILRDNSVGTPAPRPVIPDRPQQCASRASDGIPIFVQRSHVLRANLPIAHPTPHVSDRATSLARDHLRSGQIGWRLLQRKPSGAHLFAPLFARHCEKQSLEPNAAVGPATTVSCLPSHRPQMCPSTDERCRPGNRCRLAMFSQMLARER